MIIYRKDRIISRILLYLFIQYDILYVFAKQKSLQRHPRKVTPQAPRKPSCKGEISMASLTQAPATRERLNELVAELFGDQPTPPPHAPASLSTADQRWQQAVTQVGELLRAKLRVEILPERMRKALELVGA